MGKVQGTNAGFGMVKLCCSSTGKTARGARVIALDECASGLAWMWGSYKFKITFNITLMKSDRSLFLLENPMMRNIIPGVYTDVIAMVIIPYIVRRYSTIVIPEAM